MDAKTTCHVKNPIGCKYMVNLLRCAAKDSEIVTVQLQQAQHVAFWLQLDNVTEDLFKNIQ